jgi:hypothetical protein
MEMGWGYRVGVLRTSSGLELRTQQRIRVLVAELTFALGLVTGYGFPELCTFKLFEGRWPSVFRVKVHDPAI